MDNKTLDGILIALKEYGQGVDGTRFMDDNHQLINGNKWETMRNFLSNKGYIHHTQMVTNNWWICITPEGERFISEGGFSAEDSYKKRTLTYSYWAMIASISSILLAILFFIIDKCNL